MYWITALNRQFSHVVVRCVEGEEPLVFLRLGLLLVSLWVSHVLPKAMPSVGACLSRVGWRDGAGNFPFPCRRPEGFGVGVFLFPQVS